MYSFEIGDLIELKQHCKDRNRIAVVVDTESESSMWYTIVFQDTGEKVNAIKNNMVVVSESW